MLGLILLKNIKALKFRQLFYCFVFTLLEHTALDIKLDIKLNVQYYRGEKNQRG